MSTVARTAASLVLAAAVFAAEPPAGMVRVLGGEYERGSAADADNPPARVRVAAFDIDAAEVTNREYLRFVEATGHRLPEFWGSDQYRSGPKYPDHPVTGVSWFDAEAYAKWAGKRLPTEDEWEYAARGRLAGKPYPNGDAIEDANHYAAGQQDRGTRAVRTGKPNGYGLYNIAGNVAEWTSASWPHARFRVIRGGGWHSGPSCNTVHYRNALPAQWVDFNVGFRCVRDVR